MKPYKIIKSKNPCLKRKKLVGKLKETKIPFRLFKNVHPPRRVYFYWNEDEILPPSGSCSLQRRIIQDQSDHQQIPDRQDP